MKFKFIVGVVLLMLGALPALAQESNLGALEGSWTLVSYGAADAPTAVLEDAPITAVFSAEGIQGEAGCNSYFGTFTFDSATLSMSPLASTRKACADAVMEQEVAYLVALEGATGYQAGDATLLINYEGGVLTFVANISAIEATPIPDTGDSSLGGLAGTWTLVSYGAAGAAIPVLESAPITATFGGQGVSGSAGCNGYNGNFSYNNGTLVINSLASTEKACVEAGVSEQESAYLAALQSASTYQVSGGQLVVNYVGGALTFAFDASSIEPTAIPDTGGAALGGLAGSWLLVTYGAVEAPVAVLETAPITAVFSAEGIKGEAGCNSYFGTFIFDNATLTMSPLASTRIACEDSAVMEQEAAYLAALEGATGYQVGGGQLLVNYEGGTLTFALDSSVGEATPAPDGSDSSLGGLAGSWTLVSYGGGQPVLADYPITADFTAQGVSGNASCNSYSAVFTYSNGTVTIGELVTTLMACSDQTATEQEAAYLAALATTGSYQVNGEQLIIGYEGGALTFEAAG